MIHLSPRPIGLSALVLVVGASLGRAQDSFPQYHRGQITFAQGSKEARWQLLSSIYDADFQLLHLTYTPDGKGGGEGDPQLMLTIARSASDSRFTVYALNIIGGPGGDTGYATEGGFNPYPDKCILRMTPAAGGPIEGSGTCESRAAGVPVTKFTFTASP